MSKKNNRKLRAFLCHANEDKSTVRDLFQRLSTIDWIEPWFDEEKLLPGHDWMFEIEKAVETTDAVVVVLSTNSVDKEGFVQRELRFTLDIALEKPQGTMFIIPLRLDGCKIPRQINRLQYVDYFPDGNKDWAYSKIQKSLEIRAWALNIKSEKAKTEQISMPQKQRSTLKSDAEHFLGPLGRTVSHLDNKLMSKEEVSLFQQGEVIDFWRKTLDDLVGLKSVKEQITKLENYMLASKKMIAKGEASKEFPTLHMAFLGNPGTGKTTIARYMGEMFRNLGFLKKGHTVEVRVADLVAGYVGQTGERTRNRIEEAYDGVLFIDEAHQLAEEDGRGYKQEVIDELVPALENERHRLVVIFSGYSSGMSAFFRMDPGLSERIPQRNHIEFPDYKSEELLQILYKILGDRGLTKYGDEFENTLESLTKNMYDHRPAEFQNARVMRNLAESIDIEYKNRITKQELSYDSPLSLEDIPKEVQEYLPQTLQNKIENKDIPSTVELMAPLNKLIGLQEVKNFVENLVNRLIADQARRQNGQQVPRANLHMLFIGNPGTGKTTVARLMGEILRKLGYLKSGHVHEVTSKDLVAGFVGQSAGQTAKNIERALDGVLFIDEAYQLRTDQGSQNDFTATAITTLMKAMEDYVGRLVVIAAGYPDEMNRFTESNPGLSRRFGSNTISFSDFDDEELIAILKKKITDLDAHLTEEAEEKARKYIRYKRNTVKNFGNAGEVNNLFQNMYNSQSNRYTQEGNPRTLDSFTKADIPDIPKEFTNDDDDGDAALVPV